MATLTVFPDPHTESTSVDGFAHRGDVNETFAALRAGAGTLAVSDGATEYIARLFASTTTDQFKRLTRGVFLFDTSALTADATVSAETLSIYLFALTTGLGTTSLQVVASTPASDTDLVAADYAELGTTSFASLAFGSVADAAYNDLTLNASGLAAISKTGITKYGTRTEWDRAGSFDGSWSSDANTGVAARFADTADTTSDPKLVLTYEPAPPLSITTTTLPDGSIGVAYNQTIVVSGGTEPYAFSVSAGALPTGLSIHATTGAITGTPTTGGVFSFTIQVEDDGTQVETQAYTVTIVYVLASVHIEGWDGAAWQDIVGDTRSVDGLQITYGIQGRGALDLLADPGTCAFTLINRGPVGKYSPAHVDVLSWWAVDTPIRVRFVAGGVDVIKFRGTIQIITPEPGQYGTKRVSVLATDYIAKLMEAEIANITAKVNTTDTALIQAVYDALPSDFSPPATDFDDAIDTYPYAFDQVGPGDAALSLLQDVIVSTFGLIVQKGDGTHTYINRETRTYTPSVDTFTDDDMRRPDGLSVPVDAGATYGQVVMEIPQIVIGDAPEVLAFETGTDPDPIPAGATVERWLEYRDPNDTATQPVRLAGTDMIDDGGNPGFLHTDDYEYNTQADGLGTDLTSDVEIAVEFFSGTAKLTIENTSGSTAHRISLQLRGTAIRRFAPRTVRAGTSGRTFRVSSPFQNSTSVAQFEADVIHGQFGTALQRPQQIGILPYRSDRLMQHAMEREPGDRITITEPVTGTMADAIIHSVSLTVKGPCYLADVRWGLGPQSAFLFITPWELGNAGFGELGETTVLG